MGFQVILFSPSNLIFLMWYTHCNVRASLTERPDSVNVKRIWDLIQNPAWRFDWESKYSVTFKSSHFLVFYKTLRNAFHLFKVRWWGLIGQWTPALAVSCAQTCQWWEAATRCPFYFDKLTSPALDFNPLKRDCSMFRVCAISPCPLGSRRLLKYPLSLGLTVKVSLKHGHVVKPLVWYFCLT